jgi:hypothetical protein
MRVESLFAVQQRGSSLPISLASGALALFTCLVAVVSETLRPSYAPTLQARARGRRVLPVVSPLRGERAQSKP